MERREFIVLMAALALEIYNTLNNLYKTPLKRLISNYSATNKMDTQFKPSKGEIESLGDLLRVEYEDLIIPYEKGKLICRIYRPKEQTYVKGAVTVPLGIGGPLDKVEDDMFVGDDRDKYAREIAGRGLFALTYNSPSVGYDKSMVSDGKFILDEDYVAAQRTVHRFLMDKFKVNEHHNNIGAFGHSLGGYVIALSAMQGTEYCAVSLLSPLEDFMETPNKGFIKFYGFIKEYTPFLREAYAKIISAGANILFSSEDRFKEPFTRYFYIRPQNMSEVFDGMLEAPSLLKLAEEKNRFMKSDVLIFLPREDGVIYKSLDYKIEGDKKTIDVLRDKWKKIAPSSEIIPIPGDHDLKNEEGQRLSAPEFKGVMDKSAKFLIEHMH